MILTSKLVNCTFHHHEADRKFSRRQSAALFRFAEQVFLDGVWKVHRHPNFARARQSHARREIAFEKCFLYKAVDPESAATGTFH